METKREQITTEVVFNGDRTYEIKRRIEGYKGDKAILIINAVIRLGTDSNIFCIIFYSPAF